MSEEAKPAIEEVEAEVIDPPKTPKKKVGRAKAHRDAMFGQPGAANNGTFSKTTQQLILAASAKGVTPIEVMLANMRWWYGQAEHIQRRIQKLLSQVAMEPEAENVKELCEALDLLNKWREKAQDAAVDAAPYMHPKLGAVVIKGDAENPLFVQLKTEERRNVIADRLARLSDNRSEEQVSPDPVAGGFGPTQH